MTDVAGEQLIAALDLGTNSFHMVIARVSPNGFEVVAREKDTVRLGHGGGDMKELSAEAIERGIASLVRMHRIAGSLGAVERAVATSAVREADNADAFIRRARTEAGIEIEVISGLEEARLIHLGVLQALPVYDERLILVDIGGGSTEVLIGEHGEQLAARSFKLGAVRLTDRFFPGGASSSKAVDACRSYVRSMLVLFEREIRAHGFDVAVVSSGTAETVARVVHAARGGENLRTYNGFEFSRYELDEITAGLCAHRTSSARRAVPGLDSGRADIIVAGALVLQAIAHSYDIERFVFSEGALREGVLLDTVARLGGGLDHLRDVSMHGVRALAERCDDDPSHSARVADLALQLFDDTQLLHGLDNRCRLTLEAAALLANVGLVVSHSKHHIHSYYVIRNSELTGLTDHEIELIALIARYHRKSAPKSRHTQFDQLSTTDQHVVRVLAGVLRVAIGLDRSHDGRVAGVQARTVGDALHVEVQPTDQRSIELELFTANERSALLAEVLDRPVEVVAGPV